MGISKFLSDDVGGAGIKIDWRRIPIECESRRF
jgi:hypothetical protein